MSVKMRHTVLFKTKAAVAESKTRQTSNHASPSMRDRGSESGDEGLIGKLLNVGEAPFFREPIKWMRP